MSTPSKVSRTHSTSSIPIAVNGEPSKKQASLAGNAAGSTNTSKPANLNTSFVKPKTVGTNEKILSDVLKFYTTENGLVSTAKTLNVETQISKPRQKVTVLLIGNHSAGKSSFINWYIQEPILKTSVAMETQGINIIVSGKKRDTLKGYATLELFPHLKKLKKIPGVVKSLGTEVTLSKARNFDLVTFIDTPGLVDGSMNYPFDINKTLVALGEMADLIFVFFDPIGQALCKRTLDILEQMWAAHGDSKIRLYLAKADEAGGDRDRQKVMMQIVQELCKRPGINRTGFDMPAIYIPPTTSAYSISSDFGRSKIPRCTNQIEEACKDIDRAVGLNVQNSLENLDKDCSGLAKKLQKRLDDNAEIQRRNAGKTMYRMFLRLWAILIPVLAFLCVAAVSIMDKPKNSFPHRIWNILTSIEPFGTLVDSFVLPMGEILADLPKSFRLPVILAICIVVLFLWVWSRRFYPEETISPGTEKSMKQSFDFIQETQVKQSELYQTYLQQIMPDNVIGDGDAK